ncbi:MAG: DUF4258 domain-containing protein [Clostridiales bacterium]|nr:DUF4258 domain-containing protein [Clostridiales bacterium]
MQIEQIRNLFLSDRYITIMHCMKRMVERGISDNAIACSIQTGEIIEEYPDDFPYPSCLISGNGLHIVVAMTDETIWLVTAYKSDPEQWDPALKTRRT